MNYYSNFQKWAIIEDSSTLHYDCYELGGDHSFLYIVLKRFTTVASLEMISKITNPSFAIMASIIPSDPYAGSSIPFDFLAQFNFKFKQIPSMIVYSSCSFNFSFLQLIFTIQTFLILHQYYHWIQL